MPRTAGTLTELDAGAFCLSLGSQIAVFLGPSPSAPPRPERWSTVVSSAPEILAAASGGVLTAPVGVTPGIFHGVTAGKAQLTSTTKDGKSWQVTIIIA